MLLEHHQLDSSGICGADCMHVAGTVVGSPTGTLTSACLSGAHMQSKPAQRAKQLAFLEKALKEASSKPGWTIGASLTAECRHILHTADCRLPFHVA